MASKAKRDAARRILNAGTDKQPGSDPVDVDIDLAMRVACEAEGVPRADLERRILMEWLLARGYLK